MKKKKNEKKIIIMYWMVAVFRFVLVCFLRAATTAIQSDWQNENDSVGVIMTILVAGRLLFKFEVIHTVPLHKCTPDSSNNNICGNTYTSR